LSTSVTRSTPPFDSTRSFSCCCSCCCCPPWLLRAHIESVMSLLCVWGVVGVVLWLIGQIQKSDSFTSQTIQCTHFPAMRAADSALLAKAPSSLAACGWCVCGGALKGDSSHSIWSDDTHAQAAALTLAYALTAAAEAYPRALLASSRDWLGGGEKQARGGPKNRSGSSGVCGGLRLAGLRRINAHAQQRSSDASSGVRGVRWCSALLREESRGRRERGWLVE